MIRLSGEKSVQDLGKVNLKIRHRMSFEGVRGN